MSGETCNIFGCKINRRTGELTTEVSQLHSDLLDLTKEVETEKARVRREAANRGYLVNLDEVFTRKYWRELFVDFEEDVQGGLIDSYDQLLSRNETIEPSIWTLHDVLLQISEGEVSADLEGIKEYINSYTGIVTTETVLKYYNNKFKDTTYDSYQDALSALRDNAHKFPARGAYMLTIGMNTNGQFILQATENTVENQQKLLKDLAAFENSSLILELLKAKGVGVSIILSIQDVLLKESSPQEGLAILDNIEALLLTSSTHFNALLAYKTALLIVKSLLNAENGKPHPLINRLIRLAENEYNSYRSTRRFSPFMQEIKSRNPKLWEALDLENGSDLTAVAAFILAGYLENMNATNEHRKANEDSSPLVRIAKRIIDWCRTLWGSKNIRFTNTKLKARHMALLILKDLTKDTYMLNTQAVTNEKQGVREDTKTLFDTLTQGLLDLDYTLLLLKDVSYGAYTTFDKQLKERITNFHKIVLDIEGGVETAGLQDVKAQVEMMNELTALIVFIGENLSTCKDLLRLVINGVDLEGNALEYNQSAKVVKYAENILKLAKGVLYAGSKIDALIDGTLSFTGENGFTYSMATYKANLNTAFKQLADITTAIPVGRPGSTPDDTGSLQTALDEAREKVAVDLLVEINGGNYIAIELYVSFKGLKLVKNAAKLYNVQDDLLKRTITGEDSVDCCPPAAWISNFIDAMADSPDIVNLMLHDKVALQKHSANIKTLNMMERLRALYRAIPKDKMGMRYTRKYMEVDDDGVLTGNIITTRHYGNWEKAFAEYKKWFAEDYFQKHKDEFKTRDEMFADKMYLVEFGKAMEKWHQYNSKKVGVVHVKDGTPVTYDDGTLKQMYVPLIEEERIEREQTLAQQGIYDAQINTYDNAAFQDLTKEDKEWLKEYLSIKLELDDYLPQGSTPMGGIRVPQFEGTLTNKFCNIIRLGGKTAAFAVVNYLNTEWDDLTGRGPFETEFGGEHNTYSSDLYDAEGNIIFTRAHSNRIQAIEHLPMFGVRKLSELARNHLSTDLCSSLLAYASMVYNYDALNQVIAAVDVTREAIRTQRIGKTGKTVEEAGQIHSQEAGIYGRLEDYMHQQVYSIYTDSNKSRANRAFRKIFLKLTRMGSSWYLGWNMHGGTVNVLTGWYQMIRRAMKGDGFTKTAFLKALAIYFLGMERTKGRIEAAKNLVASPGSDWSYTHDALNLFKKRYDVSNDNLREFRRWGIGTIGYKLMFKLSLGDLMHLCYSFFSDFMETVPYLAVALDTNLRYKTTDKNGNEVYAETNLWNAVCNSIVEKEEVVRGVTTKTKIIDFDYSKYYIFDKNATDVRSEIVKQKTMSQQAKWQQERRALNVIPPDKDLSEKEKKKREAEITTLNSKYLVLEEGGATNVYVPFDIQQESRFRNRAQGCNNAMHGIYNTQDGGAMMRYAAAGAIASLRKYAIGLFDDRFARARYDFRTRSVKLGDYVTLWDTFWAGIVNPFVDWKDKSTGKKAMSSLYLLNNLLLFSALPIVIFADKDSKYARHFKKLGLSQSLIRGLKGCISDQYICLALEMLLSLWAPPELVPPPDDLEEGESKEEHDKKIEAYKKELGGIWDGNYSWKNRVIRAFEGNFHLLFWYPFGKDPDAGAGYYIENEPPYMNMLEEAFMRIYLWGARKFPGQVTVDDSKVLTEKYLKDTIYKGGVQHYGMFWDKKEEKWKLKKGTSKGTVPFSLAGIAYYTTYRNLVELMAYNPLYLNSVHTEFRSLLNSSLPCTLAMMDVISIGTQFVLEGWLKRDPAVYTRGINIDYYKWFKRLLKSCLNPFRSFASVYMSGYEAKENFDHFLLQEGDNYLQHLSVFQYIDKVGKELDEGSK